MAEEQSLVLVGFLSIPEALEPHITTATPEENSSVVPSRIQSSSTLPAHQQPPDTLQSPHDELTSSHTMNTKF